ncbi:L-gulonolactone/D-arabinono-1,4-lactone oxidase [Dichomitus squalens]|uniref:D-arabinono-1,4-lactone oxidase n=1 Tax=Dichomitus squalens TaxID=114155 RepID=A0A4Q9PYX9_9APHY|nr:L-gulonolactone/D-arabinono-1,4-lactone oxidase [Dichomitus squalens]
MPSPVLPASPSKLGQLTVQQLWELLAPVTAHPHSPRGAFTNWGLTFACRPLCVFEPETEAQCALVLELARREGKKVRVAGVGHSPSDLACTSEYMLRTEKLDEVIEVSREKHYIIAQAGITLNALHDVLAQHGLAMKNLGSISDQTLGGVVTTATHGSGIDYPVISMDVRALVLLLADGSRVRCSRQENPDLFMASVCGLGSTGLILEVTLDVEPAFRLKEVQETHPFEDVVRDLDSVARAAEHVRLWWFPHAGVIRVSSSNRTHEPRRPIYTWLWHSLVGYHLLQFLFFLGRYLPNVNNFVGRLGAWLVSDRTVAVDDSHRIFNVDCKYPQYTTEWAIPYDHTQACLRELRAWLDEELAAPSGLRPHFPVEIRFSDADDIWLSPSNGQKTTWIGLIQYKPYGTNVPYRKLFARFEQFMLRHAGRPHWAKTHPLRPDDLRASYPRFDDFVALVARVDPHGVFRNPYVERHFFGKQGPQYDARVFKARAL